MVRREADGSTLYWIQNGVKVVVTPMEYQYGVVVATQGRQIEVQKVENQQAKDNYLTAYSNAMISINAGRPAPLPVKPKMIVVADPVMDDYGDVTQGAESEVDWIPPLPPV